MPNHVTNIIKANKHVLDFLKGEESDVDFNTVVPMPDALKNLSAEYTTFGTQEEVDAYNAKQRAAALNWPEGFRPSPDQVYAITNTQYGDLVAQYGTALDWYNWNTHNWGTKWNAYSIKRKGDTELEFETAWAHPEPVIVALSKKFPDEVIVVQYADEDTGHNVGEYAIQEGATISANIPEGGSNEACEMAVLITEGKTLAQWRTFYKVTYPGEWEEYYGPKLDAYIDGETVSGELES